MNEISKWAVIICIISICATLLNSIAPKGNMQNAFKFILCAFVLYGFLKPLYDISNSKIDLSKIEYKTEITDNFTDKIFLQEKSLAEQNIKTLVEHTLESIDIFPSEIQITMDKLDDDSIYVKDIIIAIYQKDIFNKSKIENKINEYLGIFPKVYLNQ